MQKELVNLNENRKQYVSFNLNQQLFGIEVESVIEVLNLTEITRVIHTPEFITGIINLRGNIIAIIDLKLFLNIGLTHKTEDSKIIIVKVNNKTLGILVDKIFEIMYCDEIDKESLPVTVSGKMSEILKGVLNAEGQPLMLLNLQTILNTKELKDFE